MHRARANWPSHHAPFATWLLQVQSCTCCNNLELDTIAACVGVLIYKTTTGLQDHKTTTRLQDHKTTRLLEDYKTRLPWTTTKFQWYFPSPQLPKALNLVFTSPSRLSQSESRSVAKRFPPATLLLSDHGDRAGGQTGKNSQKARGFLLVLLSLIWQVIVATCHTVPS